MSISNIIDIWMQKNPNVNLENYETRKSLSSFIQKSLEDKHIWRPIIEHSSECNTPVNKKPLNCENKISYLNSIKSIIQVKLNERDHLFENLIKKLNITDQHEMDCIYDYVVNDFGTEKSINKMIKNDIDI